jgi:hypothetical protein
MATKHADLDAGGKRLLLETEGDVRLILRTVSQLGPIGTEKITLPLDRAGILAGALNAVAPNETRDGAAPWIEDDEPQPVSRFYLGDDDFLRVRKSRAGFVIERGRYEGTVFRATLMVGVPDAAAGFVIAALTGDEECQTN